jgi:vesicle-associated membrane protein 4
MAPAPQANHTTNSVQRDVDEVVGVMQGNIHKVMQRGEQLETIQNKTGFGN